MAVELDGEDLKQVPRAVGAKEQDPVSYVIAFHIDHECVVHDVADVVISDAMPARVAVNLHMVSLS